MPMSKGLIDRLGERFHDSEKIKVIILGMILGSGLLYNDIKHLIRIYQGREKMVTKIVYERYSLEIIPIKSEEYELSKDNYFKSR